jgi:hypothetical protein
MGLQQEARIDMRSPFTHPVALLILLTLSVAVSAGPTLAGTAQPGTAAKLPPRDAGARYGEAAGAALVCTQLKITPRVAELRANYEGDALAEFDSQAAKILQAWRDTQTCEHANGPADCKVTQQLSCKLAFKEIGPGGTAIEGLVETKD